MWRSSTVAFRNGSAYCDRPIQFWSVLPRLDGRSVTFGLVPTAVPLTYSVAVFPDSVTATCDQVFSGSCPAVLLTCCSAPPPPVVMANRGPPPALMVRNMLAVVPVPKSKIRDQVLMAAGLTQADTVKSPVSPLTMPVGRSTYSLWPLSFTALPIRPVTRGPVASPRLSGSLVTSPFAHSRAKMACLMSAAMPFISAALALSPSRAYSAAAALAPAYQNDVSVRSCG